MNWQPLGQKVDDSELVSTMLKEFIKQWTLLIKGIVALEKLLDWARLWDDFM